MRQKAPQGAGCQRLEAQGVANTVAGLPVRYGNAAVELEGRLFSLKSAPVATISALISGFDGEKKSGRDARGRGGRGSVP